MNVDSIFQIGCEHKVCQDYAIAGTTEDKTAYAIVCDGCSGSPDVDLGARLLAMAAKNTLLHMIDLGPSLFGEVSIRTANDIFGILPLLHPQSLDATLLMAMVKGDTTKVYIYGDGILVHRQAFGTSYFHLNLTSSNPELSGAPDYLSYTLDYERKRRYDMIPDNTKHLITNINIPTTRKLFEPFVYTTHVEPGDVISVISDGMNSFRKADSTAIDWKDLIDEFTAYKSTAGEFVVRRMMAFKNKCKKEGWTHYDDLSVASIIV